MWCFGRVCVSDQFVGRRRRLRACRIELHGIGHKPDHRACRQSSGTWRRLRRPDLRPLWFSMSRNVESAQPLRIARAHNRTIDRMVDPLPAGCEFNGTAGDMRGPAGLFLPRPPRSTMAAGSDAGTLLFFGLPRACQSLADAFPASGAVGPKPGQTLTGGLPNVTPGVTPAPSWPEGTLARAGVLPSLS